jgi:hypothetical protein
MDDEEHDAETWRMVGRGRTKTLQRWELRIETARYTFILRG